MRIDERVNQPREHQHRPRRYRQDTASTSEVALSSHETKKSGKTSGRPDANGEDHEGERVFTEGERVFIELSKSQIDEVIRSAGEGGTMSILLSALRDPEWKLSVNSEEWVYPAQMEDRRLSHSLLSGLLVLSCFPSDGGYLGIAELARMLDMNSSTTHRYVTTLLAVGLLEQDPATRAYRLPSVR